MPEPRWLSEQERTAWVRLAAVLELLPGALNSQLVRDDGLTHFDYFSLAMLSEAPGRTLRMTALAARTNATLARLSRVMTRLEADGFVVRRPCPGDGRAINVSLTEQGWHTVVRAAPGHVATVRRTVIDMLTPEQLGQLAAICGRLLEGLDPEGRMSATATATS